MEFFKDRRVLLALIGGALALVAGLGIAAALRSGHRGAATTPPPASQGGLVIDTAPADDEKLDPAKPLRCFVAGQFVGELTLAACAERNGVATGALDVGVDETGALAAADEAGTVLTPLPPQNVTAIPHPGATPAPTDVAAPAAGPAGPCLRYSGAEWRQLPGDLTLNACVQALFAGRCERPGGATYGRWMLQTLRLAPGRVEISGDNRSFRVLAEQGPGCSIGPIG
jgi:hypothetical protein